MGSISEIAYGSLDLVGTVINTGSGAATELLGAGSTAAQGFLGLPEEFLNFVFGIFGTASDAVN